MKEGAKPISSASENMMRQPNGKPTDASVDTRIEIAWNAETRKLELHRLFWGTGVGWYRQQTFPLTAVEARRLLKGLRTTVQHRSGSIGSKVVALPLARSAGHSTIGGKGQ
ncbi:MAG: hypothetical protein HOP18_04645 [Deltaproteobacteria bacterium]|nr:hypothetical protein [Deltaproteobacteria bacterium]